MPRIQWSSLIADENGRIDYARVKDLLVVLAAVAGAAGLIAGLVMELVGGEDLPTGYALIASGVLLAPITGGRVADGISGVLASRRISKGAAPGRRGSDALPAPTTGGDT